MVQKRIPFTADTPIENVIRNPVFENYGRLLFPLEKWYYSGSTLKQLRLVWYNNMDPEETVEIVNTLWQRVSGGETVFYNIYTQEEKAADPEKEDTGLFFFKGKPGKKFAVCNADGGFAYVGAMQDSFPHALELSKKGYNAFALIYRPGAQTACEDLARAISFIFENAEELEVDTGCYSLWGGSAGGRMAAWLGSYGPAAFGGDDLPQPGAVILQYAGHSDYTKNDPPTFACVGENDGIASWRTMQRRLHILNSWGIPTEFHSYRGLRHGFGLGTGTVAEGWLDQAVAFLGKAAVIERGKEASFVNNFIFENSTKVYFGQGCVKEYLACKVRPYQTILLGYGGGSIKKNGIYREMQDILQNAGKTVVEFHDILPNPTYQKVQEGTRLARKHNVDMILAVGGGSVIDCCKAVSLAARYKGDIWEDYWEHPGVIHTEPLPLGTIVTTAGTGSECNGGAVITHEEKKIKTGRDYPQLNPRFALMDPTYTYSVPVKQMVSGGFDILSHIMETYFSEPNQDNVSDDVMEALMKSVIRNLRAAIQNPKDYTARSNLLWDSTLGENRLVKMGKRCDFQCHSMEHQLGAYTNCNHGFGLAVLHPVYYRHIYKEGVPKFVKFAENVWAIPRKGKTDEELALAGIEALADFIQEVGLPTTLKELGVEKAQLKEIANSCGISQGSYKRLTHQEIAQIFQECYE